ncbi:sensor histidine kinase [Methylobrevis albus]|uniref:histidine kinase n=1 Tax=Methylobrevis albus TaxID=2793297 RepID=A0A931MXR6_9HYPH|nr:sensor histidine kinase [Methylobrevis albus]MBH0237265.1 hypothetical protein [Methylobrevis albus]
MFSSLRSRILLILLIAIIPPVLVIAAIAWDSYGSARAAKLSSLSHDAELLASRMDAVPLGASRLAMTISELTALAGTDSETCGRNLGVLIDNYPGYDSIAVYDGGTRLCDVHRRSAAPATSFAPIATIDDLAEGEVRTKIVQSGAEGGVFWLAARAEDSRRSVAVTMSRSYLAELLDVYRVFPSSRAVLVDGQSSPIVMGRTSPEPGMWPADLPLEVGIGLRTARFAGNAYIFTIYKLRSFDVWLVTANLETDILAEPRQQLLVSAVAPMLMLLTALFAIWLGLNGAVLRWVLALQEANRSHARDGGPTSTSVDPRAPREFLDIAASFDTLTGELAKRNADLEREITEKRNYLRELHHRVKNNLQVIASLLALQKRALSPEHRQILRFPEDRVNAMSAVYRTTYADSETGAVQIGPMIREVIHRLQDVAGASRNAFELTVEGEGRRVALDTAVPIAMLMAEILPDYLDAAVHSGVPVSVRCIGDAAGLAIEIVGDPGVQPRSFKLSRRFVEAYLRQLGATLTETEPGRVSIVCPLDAEADKPRLVKIGGVV